MAEPDCEVCESLGYRACDMCGAPTFPDGPSSAFYDAICVPCWNEYLRPAGAPAL